MQSPTLQHLKDQFGVYVHIPYCLQRCTYCDFATYVHTEIKPPAFYVESLKKEISNKKSFFAPRQLDTLYFGGGTPSLIDAKYIVDIISELAKHGYTTGPQTEVTIEINPATVDKRKLEVYLNAGVNRFSVGAQSFSDRLLKSVNREHNSQQTLETLKLLSSFKLNFSFDLLFALPTQSLEELRHDVQVAVELGSSHISPYCLTVPEGHPLSKNRPPEDDQIEMFDFIHSQLTKNGFERYELSNYAKPGFESRHNQLYWTDQEYWGLGLSAHSYSKSKQWGCRFWNLNSFDLYNQQIEKMSEISDLDSLPSAQIEILNKAQSLTDFCYTALRLNQGLSVEKLVQKFGPSTLDLVSNIAKPMVERSLVLHENGHFRLSSEGLLISNQIFEKFAFFPEDLV